MTTPVAAGIYTRISLASLGDTTKTDDQERICRDLAAHLGWEVTEVYCDHSKTAWQKNRKRPAWDKMLRDVNAGKLTGIIVYHGDRLVRRPEDLSDLLRLADGKGIRLASPTGTKNLDSERLELWVRAAFAEEESQRISERRKAQYDRWRRQGRTRPGGGGGRCFGFETDGITHRPDEAAAVRDIAAMILSGESLGAAARELSARGHTGTKGRPFTVNAVRRILTWPRIAGLMPDSQTAAAWQPVLDRGQWETIRMLLSANSPHPLAGRGALNLLSGIAVCGACGTPLRPGRSGSSDSYAGLIAYRCNTRGCGRVSRSREHLDAYVTQRVIARLGNRANPAPRIPDAPGLAAEFIAITAALADADDAIADPSRGQLSALLARRDALTARIEQLRDLTANSGRSRLLAAHAGITEEGFEALPLAVRRSLVRACFDVAVLPSSRRGPGFRTEDVRVTPR